MAERINTGVPLLIFDAKVPGAGVLSDVYGVPENDKHTSYTLTWRTKFATNPTAVSISIQQALNDVAAEFAAIDTSTYITDGEQRIFYPFTGRFIRAIINSHTGGTLYTVEVMLT